MADRWKLYVTELVSGDEQRRTRAFDELCPRLIEGMLELPTERQMQALGDVLLESDDEHERQLLTQVLTWITSRSPASPAGGAPSRTNPEKAVAEWFWEPLRSTSIACRAWEHDRRRDEDALFDLARFLSRERYPQVEFERVPLVGFNWGDVLNGNLSTVVFVGRLGMYGKTATKYFSGRNWFRFLSDQRPSGLGPNEFDSKYHRICEYDETEQDSPKYLTREKNGTRTDYGLVQRYVVPYNVGEINVIGLWGCSTLGTLAAVKWAIELEKNNDPPPNTELTSNTTLEALVKVQAATCNYPDNWKLEPIQLEQLYIGNERWNVAKKSWGLRPNLQMEWESLSADRGCIIISGKTTRTSGLIARIMNAVAEMQLPPGTEVNVRGILSEPDFKKWEKQRTTVGKRIRDYTGGCIESVGKDCLRINALIVIR